MTLADGTVISLRPRVLRVTVLAPENPDLPVVVQVATPTGMRTAAFSSASARFVLAAVDSLMRDDEPLDDFDPDTFPWPEETP